MFHAADFIAPGKLAVAGIVVGALSGLALAQLQPGQTLAAVVKAPPIHFGPGKALDTDLLRIDGNYYAVSHGADVSMTPLTTEVVRKVGYGRTDFVTVTATSTGVYSTDGLASPHVRYPGVYSERMRVALLPFAGEAVGWSRLSGWTEIPLLPTGGYDLLDDKSPASRDGVCVSDTKVGCR